MDYSYAYSEYEKEIINKLNLIVKVDGFFGTVKQLCGRVRSDKNIRSWQRLAEVRYQELQQELQEQDISKVKAEDILSSMNDCEKSKLFDLLWKEFAVVDIRSCIANKLKNNDYPYNSDIHDAIADEVADRLTTEYELQGDVYWDAISQLLDEYGL